VHVVVTDGLVRTAGWKSDRLFVVRSPEPQTTPPAMMNAFLREGLKLSNTTMVIAEGPVADAVLAYLERWPLSGAVLAGTRRSVLF
jgi:hypothetical protein